MEEPMQVHEGETVELYALADGRGVIENRSFVRCEIVGPAVLATLETVWLWNRTTARLNEALYDLSPVHTTVVGALMAYRCSFDDCVFHRVGFVMHPGEVEIFRERMTGA